MSSVIGPVADASSHEAAENVRRGSVGSWVWTLQSGEYVPHCLGAGKRRRGGGNEREAGCKRGRGAGKVAAGIGGVGRLEEWLRRKMLDHEQRMSYDSSSGWYSPCHASCREPPENKQNGYQTLLRNNYTQTCGSDGAKHSA